MRAGPPGPRALSSEAETECVLHGRCFGPVIPLFTGLLLLLVPCLSGDVLHPRTLSLLVPGDATPRGPVFVQEPSPVMFPVGSEEKKVKLTCQVRGNPRPRIRCVCAGAFGAKTDGRTDGCHGTEYTGAPRLAPGRPETPGRGCDPRGSGHLPLQAELGRACPGGPSR